MPRRAAKKLTIYQQIAEQEQWIAEHGGSFAGYVARYGSASEPNHYGDGGEAIYEADNNALQTLYAQLPSRKAR